VRKYRLVSQNANEARDPMADPQRGKDALAGDEVRRLFASAFHY